MPDQDAADLKFRAGGVDAVDDVKPENYHWYEENQQKGNFTLYDVGASQATHLMWFNLNKVQPPVRGVKPTHGKKPGEPFVDPVRYHGSTTRFPARRLDGDRSRGAHQRCVFRLWREELVADDQLEQGMDSPDVVKHDYNPAEAKTAARRHGIQGRDGDGFLEDARGNPVSFMLKTNSSNALRVSMANFIRDDLAKVGIRMTLTPIDFNTLIRTSSKLSVRSHHPRV